MGSAAILVAGSASAGRTSRRTLVARALAIALAAGAAGAPLRAQDTTATLVAPMSAYVPTSLLDRPINRAEYRVGPGDVIDVAIIGDLNRIFSVTVGPEGNVLIPTLGLARVLGLSLDQTEARIRELVFRLYRNVDVKVSLAQVRSFKIFLVGDVPNPGVRTATAVTRVSEVVTLTNATGVRRRTVLLRRGDGDTIPVDIVRFVQTGDVTANPMLREGDALVVPSVDALVSLYGAVRYPGAYEYRAGETLAALLDVANGGGAFLTAASDSIRVTRFTGRESRTFFTLSRDEATGAAGRAFVLQPFDAIYLSSVANYKVERNATVTGQVLRPGTYAIRPDTTTLRELVALAGGLAPEASLTDATLRRETGGAVMALGARALSAIPPELLSSEERRIQAARGQGDPQQVVIDLRKLLVEGDRSADVRLRSGDLLHVPTDRGGVIVLGAVANPGLLEYRASRTLSDYVELAGGYGKLADKGAVTVLKARSQNRTAADDRLPIERGDQIVVPFEEKRTFFERLQLVQSLVATVSGIVLTIFALKRLN